MTDGEGTTGQGGEGQAAQQSAGQGEGQQQGGGTLMTGHGDGGNGGAQKQGQGQGQQQQQQQGDDKAGEQQQGEQGKSQVPEKYDLSLPEGSKLNDESLASIAETAKTLGLSNDQAQELVKSQSDAVTKAVDGYTKAQQEAFDAERGKWVDQAKADKEIGGEKFDASVSDARKAIEKFGSEDFKAALNQTGFGNHPELLRVFARVGRAMGEDSFVQSGGSQGDTSGNDPASILYPNESGQKA